MSDSSSVVADHRGGVGIAPADRIEHDGEATIGERQHQAAKNMVSLSEGVGTTNRHQPNRSHPDALTIDAEFVTAAEQVALAGAR